MNRTKRYLRAILAALFLAVIPLAASSAVAISDSWLSTSGGTCNLTSPPANGTIVLVSISDTSGTPPAITDSNSVTLTLLVSGVNSTAHTWIYGYIVIGTPTAAYMSAVAASMGCIGISGGSFATATGVTGTGTATSVSTSAMPNIPAGSILVVVEANTAATAYSSLTGAGVGVNAFGTGTRMGFVLSAGALTAPVGTVNFGSSPITTISMVGIWPGPALVQKADCGAGGTCTVTGPTAGNTEIVQATVSGALSGSVSDSVGTFTLQHSTSSSTLSAGTYDRKITGTPSTTITVGLASLQEACFAELSGLAATGSNLFTGATAASGTVVGTLPGVAIGDFQFSTGVLTGSVPAVTFSNNAGGTVTACSLGGGGNVTNGRYAFATSTASSTSTFTGSTITNPALEYADYVVPANTPAPGPTSTSVPGTRWQGVYEKGAPTGFLGSFILLSSGSYVASKNPGMTCIMRLDGITECWRTFPAAWAA